MIKIKIINSIKGHQFFLPIQAATQKLSFQMININLQLILLINIKTKFNHLTYSRCSKSINIILNLLKNNLIVKIKIRTRKTV